MTDRFFAWLAKRIAPYLADAIKIEALAIVEEMSARMAEQKKHARYIGEK